MPRSSASPSSIGTWVISYISPPRAVLGAVASVIVAISTPDANATGPDLPLQFDDSGRDIVLTLDPGRFSRVDVDRVLYGGGRPLREQRLDLKREARPDGKGVAIIPLELGLLSNLPPGYYAIKLVAVGAPLSSDNSAGPLHVEWWAYVAVDGSGVRRITSEEYSAAVDPATVGRAESGRQILLHGGGGAEAKVPLQQTEHHQAIPLGRSDGALEEAVTPR
jgi:hypothetical protein